MPESTAADCLCDQHFGNQITKKARLCKKMMAGRHAHCLQAHHKKGTFSCMKDTGLSPRHLTLTSRRDAATHFKLFCLELEEITLWPCVALWHRCKEMQNGNLSLS